MTHRFFACAAIQAGAALRITCLMAMVLSVGISRAAEPTPAAALSASGQQAVAGQTYNVVRGDTLDRIIQTTLRNSPLKIELLRKAFVDLNPQAFVSGNVSRLRAGVVLQVPDHAQLLRSTVLPLLADTDAALVTGEARSPNASERRRWIRFP